MKYDYTFCDRQFSCERKNTNSYICSKQWRQLLTNIGMTIETGGSETREARSESK